MEETKLSVGELLNGGLEELSRAKGSATLWFVAIAAIDVAYNQVEQKRMDVLSDLMDALTITAGQPWWLWLFIYFILQSILIVLATWTMMPAELRGDEDVSSKLIVLVTANLAYIISLAGITVATLFLILPGLYLTARWYILIPLVISRRVTLANSFGLSWTSTKSTAGGLMGATLIIFLPLILVSFLTGTVSIGRGIEFELFSSLSSICSAGSVVFGIAISIFAYRKLIDDSHEMQEVFA